MDRRTFLKRTGQTIAGLVVAPLVVAAATPVKIPAAQKLGVYVHPGMVAPGSWQKIGTAICMISAGTTPADPLNVKVIQPEDFYK